MEIFELIRDEKVIIWSRDWCKVEAESLEEAVEKVKNYEESSCDCGYLYETVEQIPVDDNDGYATIEIINPKDDNVLWDNSKLK